MRATSELIVLLLSLVLSVASRRAHYSQMRTMHAVELGMHAVNLIARCNQRLPGLASASCLAQAGK